MDRPCNVAVWRTDRQMDALNQTYISPETGMLLMIFLQN